MTVLLGALVLVGRIVLILLLVVLLAVVLLLLAPVGLTIHWKPTSGVTVGACAGPLRYTLYPWRHRKKHRKEKKSKQKPAENVAAESNASPTEQKKAVTESPTPTPDPAKEKTPQSASPAPASETDTEPPLPPMEEEPEELTPGEQNALLGATRIFFGTLAPHRQRLLKGVQVRKLQVFWTVTGADAADTAVSYGRWIAVSNNLLALARQYLTIRAESLRLEPDFTGQMAEKRIFSCQILTRPYIILLILLDLMHRDEQGQNALDKIMDKLGTLA